MPSKAFKRYFQAIEKFHSTDIPFANRTHADFKNSRKRADEHHSSLFPVPEGIKYTPVNISGVKAEWAEPAKAPANKAVLYIHGGAWSEGSIVSHRHFAGGLAKTTGLKTIALDYRLAPENPYPAGLEDCLTVYQSLINQGFKNIIVGGESAGGNLSLALVLRLKDEKRPLPRGVFILSPGTDFLASGRTHVTKAKGDSLAGTTASLAAVYAPGKNLANPYVSPVYGNYRNFPPLFIQVGSSEVLLSDSLLVAERAAEADVDVTLRVWRKLGHAFAIAIGQYPEADAGLVEIADFIKARIKSR